MTRALTLGVVAYLLLVILASGPLSGTLAGRQYQGFPHERGVAVPMRDGVTLRADVLRPEGTGRFPTLVYRTPYGRARTLDEDGIFRKAVARGYAVVVQDVRGRYDSEGEFMPYFQEGRDGFDTIEWAARQPWSTGAVGRQGGERSITPGRTRRASRCRCSRRAERR